MLSLSSNTLGVADLSGTMIGDSKAMEPSLEKGDGICKGFHRDVAPKFGLCRDRTSIGIFEGDCLCLPPLPNLLAVRGAFASASCGGPVKGLSTSGLGESICKLAPLEGLITCWLPEVLREADEPGTTKGSSASRGGDLFSLPADILSERPCERLNLRQDYRPDFQAEG